MKQYIFLALIVICSLGLKAQEINHPTVASFEVVYTEDPKSNFVPDSVRRVRVNAHLTLRAGASASRIHLIIKDQVSDAVVYEATYSLGSSDIINDEGITLYKKEEDSIYISSPGFMALTTYKYEVSTEDSEAVVSPIYFSVQ